MEERNDLPQPDPEAYCIKCGCGHEHVLRRWVAAWGSRPLGWSQCSVCSQDYSDEVLRLEHLHCVCRLCGYCWRTHTHEWLEDQLDGREALAELEKMASQPEDGDEVSPALMQMIQQELAFLGQRVEMKDMKLIGDNELEVLRQMLYPALPKDTVDRLVAQAKKVNAIAAMDCICPDWKFTMAAQPPEEKCISCEMRSHR